MERSHLVAATAVAVHLATSHATAAARRTGAHKLAQASAWVLERVPVVPLSWVSQCVCMALCVWGRGQSAGQIRYIGQP